MKETRIMADIVKFPGSKNPPTPEEAAQRKIEAQAHHAERSRRLRMALKEPPRMQGDDQITAAEALHGLLERMEQRHGVRKKEVLRGAGIGSKEDSTKHLSQYAIPQDLTPEEVRMRSKRLRKNVRPYLAIAKAAAKLAGLDEDEVLLELFGHAGSWARSGTREPAPESEKLAERLRFVTAGIARKYELTAFFREVEKAGVAPIPSMKCFERDTGRPVAMEEIEIEFIYWSQEWPIEFNQPSWEAETEAGERLPA
jgi:hypothetical protein